MPAGAVSCYPLSMQGLNRRDASIFDLYSLDTITLELSLVMINPGDVSSWEMDYEFNVRVRSRSCQTWLGSTVAVGAQPGSTGCSL